MRNNSLLFRGLLLASSIGLTGLSWAMSPVNTINDGHIIKGGTYYNTAGNTTTFTNTRTGGLWLKAGTTVRGLEANASRTLTNHGGSVHLYAPNNVVRVDGTIDVNALRNSQGAYLGNGGNVFVDSAYLFQNGNIFAMGANGGHVMINVNSATFGPYAKIKANAGPDGLGGTIHINATGVVDIKNNALLTTNGVPLPGVDSNVIEISAGLVNNSGIIQANGISTEQGASTGGSIHLVANGNIDLNPVAKALYKSTVFTPYESKTLFQGIHELAETKDASIHNTGHIMANGGSRDSFIDGSGGNGGTITLNACRNILNTNGNISADGGQGPGQDAPHALFQGGHGGSLKFQSGQLFQNQSLISANGGTAATGLSNLNTRGGSGGSISVQAGAILNSSTGTIIATGGPGGLGVATVGGDGGRIVLNSKNCLIDITSANDGRIEANGREGSVVGGSGGLGGNISIMSVDNNGNGIIQANGGFGQFARAGGRITLTNLFNDGYVEANGGNSVGIIGSAGGIGGSITNTRVGNAGLISANGGLGIGLNVDLGIPLAAGLGGRGGTITNQGVTNFGLMRTNGGDAAGIDITAGAGAGGDGGSITSWDITNIGTIQANGGNGSGVATLLKVGIGGAGGRISNTDIFNDGSVEANGGTGNGTGNFKGSVFALGIGGSGGQINHTNVTNNGVISANGGRGNDFSNLIAIGFGGFGGRVILNNVTNQGNILANGGAGYLGGVGGLGGNISINNNVQHISSGLIQANGGADPAGAGGSGGHININGIFNTGRIETNGGSGRLTLLGSFGGTIALRNIVNNGLIRANGGDNGLPLLGIGGEGGSIVISSSINNATIQANGGFGNALGGLGGNISANNSTNNGIISANGRGSAIGGHGGAINVSNFINTGTVEANGGNSSLIFSTGGDGGLISGTNVTNTGTAQANGGSGGLFGGSGNDGTVSGF